MALTTSFYEDNAMAVVSSSRIVFTLCRLYSFSILITIIMSVESKIDVGSGSLREICFGGREVDGRQFLEDEREEELAKQGILTDILAEQLTLISKLSLYTTYEDSYHCFTAILSGSELGKTGSPFSLTALCDAKIVISFELAIMGFGF